MSGLDWLILAVVTFSVLVAIAQGFFLEAFSLAGVVLGYLFAAWGYGRVAPLFLPLAKEEWIADLAGFLTVFFVTLLIAGLAGRLTRWIMKEVGLAWFDRLLGGAFGLLRGVIVATVMVLALATFSPWSQALARSELGPYFLVLGRAAVWAAPSEVRQKFRDGITALREKRPPRLDDTAGRPPHRQPDVQSH